MIYDHPWLGELFGDAEVAELWSADSQIAHYRAFEVALAHALEACGRVPEEQERKAAKAIDNARIDVASLANGTLRDGAANPGPRASTARASWRR